MFDEAPNTFDIFDCLLEQRPLFVGIESVRNLILVPSTKYDSISFLWAQRKMKSHPSISQMGFWNITFLSNCSPPTEPSKSIGLPYSFLYISPRRVPFLNLPISCSTSWGDLNKNLPAIGEYA